MHPPQRCAQSRQLHWAATWLNSTWEYSSLHAHVSAGKKVAPACHLYFSQDRKTIFSEKLKTLRPLYAASQITRIRQNKTKQNGVALTISGNKNQIQILHETPGWATYQQQSQRSIFRDSHLPRSHFVAAAPGGCRTLSSQEGFISLPWAHQYENQKSN